MPKPPNLEALREKAHRLKTAYQEAEGQLHQAELEALFQASRRAGLSVDQAVERINLPDLYPPKTSKEVASDDTNN
jgi:Tfp pilus assembly protein PilO